MAVSTMLIAYALEDRSPAFILLFAAACSASSAYGFLAGTWPFGIVEGFDFRVAITVARLKQHPPALDVQGVECLPLGVDPNVRIVLEHPA